LTVAGVALRLSVVLGWVMAASVMPALAQPQPPRFVMACAPCHGYDGLGHDPSIPNLAGQSLIYLYNQMAAFRTGARKHPEMNFFSGQMTQEEMQAIAEFYSKLGR
jgi:cytochrome c553